jgi:chromosomal replication initiation ATPase DnaA
MQSLYEHAEEPTPPRPEYDPAMDIDEIDGMEQLIDNSQALIHAAADVMQIDPEDITSKRRTFAVSLARKIVMTLWAESHSLQDASRIVGKIHEKLLHCHKTRERVRKILQKYSEIILAENQPNA